MTKLDRAAISGRIKQARVARGMTQPELADLVDLSERAIETWESGKDKRVPFKRLDELADKLGVTTEWLLYGDGVVPAVTISPLLERLEQLVRALETLAGADPDEPRTP